jgi:hypothetical protein
MMQEAAAYGHNYGREKETRLSDIRHSVRLQQYHGGSLLAAALDFL